MSKELERMNKGFMRKDGKFFLPITHESLVVDNDGNSLVKKYVTKAMLEETYATMSYVDEAILNAQLGGDVDLSDYVTTEQLAEKADKSEIPSIEGLASEEFVKEQIAGIEIPECEQYDDSELKARIEVLEAVDHDTFLTEHQDISHLAKKEEIPSVEGLASESFVEEKIAAIEFPECEKYDDSKLVERIEAIEAIDHEQFITEHQDISGKADTSAVEAIDKRVEALEAIEHHMQPNFSYKINMIEAGQEPSVITEGEFPNIVVTFNIPMGAAVVPPVEPEDPEVEPKMWIGWIPFDQEAFDNGTEPTMGYSSLEHIDANMTKDIIQFGINNGTLIEMEPQTLNKYKIEPDEAGFLCCIVPKDSYAVTYDNGFGDKISFDEASWSAPQNDLELVNPIDGVTYCLTGGVANIAGIWFLYVDEK